MNFGELLVRFRERWQALSRMQKTMAALAALGVLVALVFLGQMLFRTPYAPLFTGLDPKDAGRITEELKKEKVPYRVTGQGKTIEVPEDKVYETRIRLASTGALYSSGVGFELFDQKKLGITEFEEQVAYQRALQEELRRTIMQLDTVEQARVHLVLPKKSYFLDEQVEPSASIALKVKPAAQVAPENVKGIVDLVAGSVEGLKPENVHIIDMDGNSLTDSLRLKDKTAGLALMTLDHYQIKRNFEKELESRIQQMLRQILGPGKAVAMVSAEMDFDQKQSTSTSYEPGQPLSQQNIVESGSGAGTGGAPGTDSDLPGSSVPSQGGTGDASFSRQESTTNYQVPSRQETVVKAPGSLVRLSASIVVNGNYPQSQLQQIKNVVAAAIGLNESRGDQIEVSDMAFDDSLQKEAGEAMLAEKTGTEEKQRNLIIAAVVGGAAVLLGLLAAYMIISRRRKEAARIAAAQAERIRLEQEAQAREDEPVEIKQRARTRLDDIKDIATKQPEDVAEIIKIWLRE